MDKKYIKELIEKGDRRSHNELAADLQLFRWNARMSGHPEWRYFEDKDKRNDNEGSSK